MNQAESLAQPLSSVPMQAEGVLSLGPAPERPDGAAARPDDAAALLDERDEWLAFSQRAAGAESGHWASSVAFEGMHCAACAGTIEQALRAVPGVLEADVSAAGQRGRVVWDERRTRPSRWMAALQGTGYRALPAHDPQASELRQAETRRMLWRLGVAGLCMMQVMMYAAPSYFTAPGEITPDIMAIAKKNLPDVNFTTAWKKANGTFEVQGKNKNGKIREIDIRPDGTIEEIE